jgi:predicted amidohydrolase
MFDEAQPPGRWEPWSARPELMPKCQVNDPCWLIETAGAASCHGGWDLHWDHIESDRRYHVDVACRGIDVPHVHDNLHAELIWWRKDNRRADWAHVPFVLTADNICEFQHQCRAPEDAVRATLRLMLRWTDRGRVAWCDPRLTPIKTPAARKLKVAIASGVFPGTSVDANTDFAIELIAAAADVGARVVCLPECITSWRCPGMENEGARPIPGRETDKLCRAAAAAGLDVVCSMNELNGKLIHNTGLYIDPKQGIVGKYRKVHLAVGERWRGITPGDEFPVWQTSYGSVGMLICYDNVMPEGHRILAQKGAEILFLPIMGDPRAIGEHARENWRRIMQVRAMDNHVWFVVCENKGEWGLIVRPDGEIAAEVTPSDGLAVAEIDLGMRYHSTIGSDFGNRYWGERRPHVYRRLVEEL